MSQRGRTEKAGLSDRCFERFPPEGRRSSAASEHLHQPPVRFLGKQLGVARETGAGRLFEAMCVANPEAELLLEQWISGGTHDHGPKPTEKIHRFTHRTRLRSLGDVALESRQFHLGDAPFRECQDAYRRGQTYFAR